MKYCVENLLDLFEFHDAEFSFISYDGNELVISAEHLNIHKDAPENPHDCDMEIELAKITFKQLKVVSFEPWRAWKVDDEGNIYFDEPKVIYKDKEAEKHFLFGLKKGISIFSLDFKKKRNGISINLSASGADGFNSKLNIKGVTVEWDGYCQKAWYELHKQYYADIALVTPEGEKAQRIQIICHYEDTYYQGELVKAPSVNVVMKFDGRELWGRGNDYLWTDAFADLQKKLPEGVTLKLCLTCRHGNLCPYGNEPGRVFCTKGLTVNSKEDMCNLFDSGEKYNMRERDTDATESCNDYEPQSKDHYTYNDYLYFFEK